MRDALTPDATPIRCSVLWRRRQTAPEMGSKAAGHLCSGFLPACSERHQQNRRNGNTLQVSGSGVQNEAARGRRGRSFAEAHYSPHGVPSADPAVFQTPTLLLPFNPPPPSGGEVTHSQTRPPSGHLLADIHKVMRGGGATGAFNAANGRFNGWSRDLVQLALCSSFAGRI